MKPQKYQALSRRIYNSLPVIGWLIRLWTAWQLAKDNGSSYATAILSEAVTKNSDAKVVAIALMALRNLKDKHSIDIVCKAWIDSSNPRLKSIIQKYNYQPVEATTKALFYFLLGDWQKYERLDFDSTLLIQAYQSASKVAKEEVSKKSKLFTRLELIKILTNANNDFEGEKITNQEWEICVDILMIKLNRREIWRFLCNAPPFWSKKLLEKLAHRSINWFHRKEEDIVRKLLDISIKAKTESFESIPYLFSQPLFYKTLTRHLESTGYSYPYDDYHLEISSDSHILVDINHYWSLLDDSHIRTFTGFSIFPIEDTLRNGFGVSYTVEKTPYSDIKIYLHRFPELTQLTTFKISLSYSWNVFRFRISPNGRVLAQIEETPPNGGNYAGGDENPYAIIKLYGLPDGNLIGCFDVDPTDYNSMAIHSQFSPNSQTLVVWKTRCRNIFLFSFSSGDANDLLIAREKIINGHAPVCISSNSKILASRKERNEIDLTSLPDGNHLKTLTGHTDYIGSIAISPNSKTLASGSRDKTIRLWSLPDGNHIKTITGHNKTVEELLISPDNSILASWGEEDLGVYLWSLPDGNHIKTLIANSPIEKFFISPNSRILVSFSKDNSMSLWSLPDGNHLKTFTGISWRSTSQAMSPDGRFLASTWKNEAKPLFYDCDEIRLWSLPDKNYRPPINKFTTQDISDIESKIHDPRLKESIRNAFKFTLALIDLRQQLDINTL